MTFNELVFSLLSNFLSKITSRHLQLRLAIRAVCAILVK